MSDNSITRSRLHTSATSTFIPADKPNLPTVVHTPSMIDILPTPVQSHHTRQDDDAITHAKASLIVAAAYIIAALMITLGLLLLVFLFRGLGENAALYFYAGLIIWGICILASLYSSRRQSLHHSASGLGHAELQSRERLARHAIDVHAQLLMERWNREQR